MPTKAAVCRWDENQDGAWETDCSHIFERVDGTPVRNGMRYCCYCGRPLKHRRQKGAEQ